MELFQLLDGQAVAPGVLGAVGEIGTVGAYRSGDQRWRTSTIACGLFNRILRKRHACNHQSRSVVAIDPAFGEAAERGLIARRDHDIGSGPEVVEMDPSDQIGLLDQRRRRPQLVVDVAAQRREVRGEASVEDAGAVMLDERGERTPRGTGGCAQFEAWSSSAIDFSMPSASTLRSGAAS